MNIVQAKKYKHICFDYYGTLVNIGDPFKQIHSWMKGMVEESEQPVSSDFLFKIFMRYYAYNLTGKFQTGEAIMRSAFIKACNRVKIVLSDEQFMLFIHELFSNPCKYDEVDYVICKLRKKYMVSILSNADNRIILHSINSQRIGYDYLVTSEDAKANKPDKAFFHMLRRF